MQSPQRRASSLPAGRGGGGHAWPAGAHGRATLAGGVLADTTRTQPFLECSRWQMPLHWSGANACPRRGRDVWRCRSQQQAQYLHQFVLHAALDAVDEAMWSTKEPHLKARAKRGKGQGSGVERGGEGRERTPRGGEGGRHLKARGKAVQGGGRPAAQTVERQKRDKRRDRALCAKRL